MSFDASEGWGGVLTELDLRLALWMSTGSTTTPRIPLMPPSVHRGTTTTCTTALAYVRSEGVGSLASCADPLMQGVADANPTAYMESICSA